VLVANPKNFAASSALNVASLIVIRPSLRPKPINLRRSEEPIGTLYLREFPNDGKGFRNTFPFIDDGLNRINQ
jgi:hypothetical protein